VGSDLVVVFVAIFWREDYRGGRNAVTHDCRSNTSELHTVQQLWKELRRGMGSAEEMLRFLARSCKRSLLGDYACLRPAP
jgi:hypothetical protein